MAKLIETKIVVKFSTIVADASDQESVISNSQFELLSKSIPELAESIVDSPAIIVEIESE